MECVSVRLLNFTFPSKERARLYNLETYFNITSCHNRANTDPNIPPDYISHPTPPFHLRPSRLTRSLLPFCSATEEPSLDLSQPGKRRRSEDKEKKLAEDDSAKR